MAATKPEAVGVYRIVNEFIRAPLRFLPCDNDEDCTPYLICGEAHHPGAFDTTQTPPAWRVADHFHVNLERVPDFNKGGAHELAFKVCHELAHSFIFPPDNLGYWVSIHALQQMYHWSGRIDFENIFRFHMDFLVNEWIYRNRGLVDHLRAHGLDVYRGAMMSYKFDPPIVLDEELMTDAKWSIIRYNEIAILRETNPAGFARINPKPRYERIERFCTAFLAADYAHWDSDQWFDFLNRTLLEAYAAGN